jgi:hypothetical protein
VSHRLFSLFAARNVMIELPVTGRTQRLLRLLSSERSEHPLITVQQHVAWEGSAWRVEANQVRDERTLEEHTAVRMSRTGEPFYSAVVVPLSSDGRLHLVSRYRYPIEGWAVEFPRFDLDGGESGWRDAAELDLFRMTGLVAARLSMLGAVYLDPALLSTSAIVILAEGCRVSAPRRRALASADPDQERPPGEIISGTLALSLAEVSELVRRGELTCGASLAALAHYRAALK